MQTSNPVLPPGYSAIPSGKIVNAVTCLEMLERPETGPVSLQAGLSLTHLERPDLDVYRSLYRLVGEDWLWSSRLELSDMALRDIIHDPRVEIYQLTGPSGPLGLLELDFREAGEGEIAFFGIAPTAIGHGAGWFMMAQALNIAWSHPIRRLWVHTCHFDHPKALPFYRRAGFRPYAFLVEVVDDPRLTGVLSETAAPHIPLLRPA